ncbi:MAG: hypothetical protein ACI9JR_002245, partial [Gammaproteobacteria bacterium]
TLNRDYRGFFMSEVVYRSNNSRSDLYSYLDIY